MAILKGRHAARIEGSFVVFVIGFRANALLRVGKWLPVARAMPPMIAELEANPQSGFLAAELLIASPRSLCMNQYWRDFDSLEAFARDRDRTHWPAWTAFNKAVGDDGSVGVFHETYVVQPGAYEAIYVNMPPFGLGKAGELVPATGSRADARSRMQAAGKS